LDGYSQGSKQTEETEEIYFALKSQQTKSTIPVFAAACIQMLF